MARLNWEYTYNRHQTNIETITYDGEKTISTTNEEERFLKTVRQRKVFLITVLLLRISKSIFNENYFWMSVAIMESFSSWY